MSLEQALAVYIHFLHQSPRETREEVLFEKAKSIIRESALQSLNRRT